MDGERVKAAARRRGRRLRAWHRHVRTTVAMELATALHHSAQRVEGPGEGEVHEKHDGLRAQMRHLPGTRPGLPPEPEPQVRAATVGYAAAPVPLLVVASLAGGDEVDATTVSFLLRDNLWRTKLEEKEKERRRVLEEEEEIEKKMQALTAKLDQCVPLSAVEKQKKEEERTC